MLEFRSEDLLGTVVWYRGGPMIGPVMAVHVDADSVAEFAASAYAKPSFAIVGNGVAHNELNKWVNEFFTDIPSQPAYKIESAQTKYFGGEERISHGSGNSMVDRTFADSAASLYEELPEGRRIADAAGEAASDTDDRDRQ